MLPPCSWRPEYNTSSAACRQHSGNAPAWPCIEGGHVLRLSAPIVVTLLLSWERFLCLLSLITVTEDGPDRQPAAWITNSIFPSAQRSFDDNKRHPNTIMMAMKALLCIQLNFFRLAFAHWLGQKPDGPHNNYGLPEATATSSPDDTKGWSLKPTEPPLPNHGPDISFIELMRRSEHWIKAKRQTTQYLNSKTCGYFTSDEFDPWVCSASETCTTNTNNVVACLSSGETGPFFSVCFDYSAYKQGLCDDRSAENPETGCCASSTNPACVMYLWPGPQPKSMFFCHPSSTIITMLDVPRSVLDASTSGTSTEPPSTTTSPPPDPTPRPPDPSAINTDAITGGVIGGVAFLSLIAAAIFFLHQRRKKKSPPSPPPPTNQNYTPVPTNNNPTPNQQPYSPPRRPDFLSLPGSSTLPSSTPYLSNISPPIGGDPYFSPQYDPSKQQPPETQQQQQGYFFYGPGSGDPGVGLYPHGTPNTQNSHFESQYTTRPAQGQEPYQPYTPPQQEQPQLSELDSDDVAKGQSGNPAEMMGSCAEQQNRNRAEMTEECDAERQSANPAETPIIPEPRVGSQAHA
ncbi:uncharacterized protein QC763_208255 [Podospora pseudopauciseta]|uniref:Uncharacterized protein n=1 Tax=Podospora pseudopauciseta TaxID=2093780 RepID=A0ABR0HQ95_9PEZI|nr:hypothetical protein QC763_208255 [Podospora pseudopauciseta]